MKLECDKKESTLGTTLMSTGFSCNARRSTSSLLVFCLRKCCSVGQQMATKYQLLHRLSFAAQFSRLITKETKHPLF